jgi:hypothetical protein
VTGAQARTATHADAVPEALLGAYSKMDFELQQLIDDIEAGKATGKAAEDRLQAVMKRQIDAFEHLFPKVWGCDFNAVFSSIVGADFNFENEISHQKDRPSKVDPWLSYAHLFLGYAHSRLGDSCSSAPAAVRETLAKIRDDTQTLLNKVEADKVAGKKLVQEMTALQERKDALVRDNFPPVFGISYAYFLHHVDAMEHEQISAGVMLSGDKKGEAVKAIERLKRHKVLIEGVLNRAAEQAAAKPVTTTVVTKIGPPVISGGGGR